MPRQSPDPGSERSTRAQTHHRIDPRLCGEVIALAPGCARVALTLTPEMAVDDRGLAHGGFVFGLADYAAMLAINHPNVVLGAAEVRFLKPAVVGERLIAEAVRRLGEGSEGPQAPVDVEVRRDGESVFHGLFTCFLLRRHVLDRR